MKKISIIALFVYMTNITAAARTHHKEELTILGFDLLSNALIAGIGASIRGDDFWPAFGKGALAGAVMHGGKQIASYTSSIPGSGAAGKMLHDIGASMGKNAILGHDLLTEIHTNIGPIGFTWHNNKDLKLSIYPVTAATMVAYWINKDTLALGSSLANLTPIFNGSGLCTSQELGKAGVNGCTTGGVIHLRPSGVTSPTTLSHELNHILVLNEFRIVDHLLDTYTQGSAVGNVLQYTEWAPSIMEGLFISPVLITKKHSVKINLPHEIQAQIMSN